MQNKVRVETKFVDMATALGLFEDHENLLALLREGRLIAHGREGWNGLDEGESLPAPDEIPAIVWRDYRFAPGSNLLTDDRDNFYSEIQIPRGALMAIVGQPKPDRGGRPSTYDWARLWPKIFEDAYLNEPQTLDGWVAQVQTLDIWSNGKFPDEKTLRDRLRESFKAMFKK